MPMVGGQHKIQHMKSSPKLPIKIGLLIFLSFLLLASCTTKQIKVETYGSDLLCSWNAAVMKIAVKEDGLLTLKGLRTEALMHTAIHDALNAIHPLYQSYSFQGNAPTADPMATAAQAAYEVVVNQYPDQQKVLQVELERWLEKVEAGQAKVAGITLGKEAATQLLTTRSDDRWNGEADYAWHPMGPGVYAEFNEHSGTPEGFIFGAGWAAAQPFLLSRPDHFRTPPPPEINSKAYTTAFNEVKQYGSTQSELRSPDQTHLAMWWKDFVEHSHNALARELVVKEKLNLWQAARLFSLLNMTVYDAYINVFDNKFHYNHWRPYTAIRWAENDENPDTEADPEWNNLHQHTYAFPSYPSAHGTASTAAMTLLANTLGMGNDYAFTMTTEEVDQAGPFSAKVKMNPATRSFTSFSEAGMEASMSRVYLGIHFRYDSEAGFELGRKIGTFTSQDYLKPLD